MLSSGFFEELLSDPRAMTFLLSTTVGLALGVAGFYSQRRNHRREYTLNVLSHAIINERIRRGRNLIRRLLSAGEGVDPKKLSVDDMDVVVDCLSYYEFLSAAFLRRDLDRETVVKQLAGSFLEVYDASKAYIEERRAQRGRRQVYENIEAVADYIRRRRL